MNQNNASDRQLKTIWRYFEEQRPDRLAQVLCSMARSGIENPLSLLNDHPFSDDWRDFAIEAVNNYLLSRSGYVYVVTNPVNKDVYKIGSTSGGKHRIKRLRTAGVLGEFHPVASYWVMDRYSVEACAHRVMAQVAQMRDRELFFTDYRTAIQVLKDAADADNNMLLKTFNGMLKITIPASHGGDENHDEI